MKAGGDIAKIKEIQTTVCTTKGIDKIQCKTDSEVAFENACGDKPTDQCADAYEPVVNGLMEACSKANAKQKAKAICIYKNMGDPAYSEKTKRTFALDSSAEQKIFSKHVDDLKAKVATAATQPLKELKDIFKEVKDTGVQRECQSLLDQAFPEISASRAYKYKGRDISNIAELKLELMLLAGVFAVGDPTAKGELEKFSKLCSSPSFGKADDSDCNEAVKNVIRRVAQEQGNDLDKTAAYFVDKDKWDKTSKPIYPGKPSGPDFHSASEAEQTLIGMESHAPRLQLKLGLRFAPWGAGFGQPKDGESFSYDDYSGNSLFQGYPFFVFSPGVRFLRTPTSHWLVGADFGWNRGKPKDVDSNVDQIEAATHWLLGLEIEKHFYVANDVNLYPKLGLQYHATSGGNGGGDVPRGPDLGPGAIGQFGLYAGVGAEWYLSQHMGAFAEFGLSWSCSKEQFLSDAQLSAHTELEQREIWNCYRTNGGVPVVPSLTAGVMFR